MDSPPEEAGFEPSVPRNRAEAFSRLPVRPNEGFGRTEPGATYGQPLGWWTEHPSRCLKQRARVVSPTGKHWTPANIGNALAGREIARHLRELGTNTRGPAPLTKQDRSRFLGALDTALQAALREAARS